MNRRTDIHGENPGTDANQAEVLSGSDRRLDAVIPFPRRAVPPSGSAAGSVPPMDPANFESLGSAVQAVIVRIAGKRMKLNVGALTPAREDGGGDRGQR